MLEEFFGHFWPLLAITSFSTSLVIGFTYLFDSKPQQFPSGGNDALRKFAIGMGFLALFLGGARALIITII